MSVALKDEAFYNLPEMTAQELAYYEGLRERDQALAGNPITDTDDMPPLEPNTVIMNEPPPIPPRRRPPPLPPRPVPVAPPPVPPRMAGRKRKDYDDAFAAPYGRNATGKFMQVPYEGDGALIVPPPLPPRSSQRRPRPPPRPSMKKYRVANMNNPGYRAYRKSRAGQALSLAGPGSMAMQLAQSAAAHAEAIAEQKINAGPSVTLTQLVKKDHNFGIGNFKADLSHNLKANWKAKQIEARAARMVYNRVKQSLYGRAIFKAVNTKAARYGIDPGRHAPRGLRTRPVS